MWKDGVCVCFLSLCPVMRTALSVCLSVCVSQSDCFWISVCLSDSVLVLSLFLNISQKLCVSVILSGFCLSLCPDICLSLFPVHLRRMWSCDELLL